MERKTFYEGLDHKKMNDNKLFWKTTKPFFPEKVSRGNNITLIDDDVIVSDDFQIAETLKTYFSEAVELLNVRIPWKVSTDYKQ